MREFEPENAMTAVIAGVRKFQRDVYPEKKGLFQSLAKKQDPKILFITCSDSRIDPAMITQTEPGSLFLIHNAGNIIPPHGTPYGGTGASIEYAINVLNVEHIIVCGHSYCGAMAALLKDGALAGAPPVIKQWVSYAETTRAIIEAECAEQPDITEEQRLHRCVARNIQVQMRHLKTFPSVASRLAVGKISLHGWFYHIETGEVDVYNHASGAFIPFNAAYSD